MDKNKEKDEINFFLIYLIARFDSYYRLVSSNSSNVGSVKCRRLYLSSFL